MIQRGGRSVGEKLECESGGGRAVQAARNHGLFRILHDRCDDRKILQVILIVEIVGGRPINKRRRPIRYKIDIDGMSRRRTNWTKRWCPTQRETPVSLKAITLPSPGPKPPTAVPEPTFIPIPLRNEGLPSARGPIKLPRIIAFCSINHNPDLIARDNIPGSGLSGANDAVERATNGGVVSIALPQAAGICPEVVAKNRYAIWGKYSRAVSGYDVARRGVLPPMKLLSANVPK